MNLNASGKCFFPREARKPSADVLIFYRLVEAFGEPIVQSCSGMENKEESEEWVWYGSFLEHEGCRMVGSLVMTIPKLAPLTLPAAAGPY